MGVFEEALRHGPTEPTLQMVRHRLEQIKHELTVAVLLDHERQELRQECVSLGAFEDICKAHLGASPNPLASFTQRLLGQCKQFTLYGSHGGSTLILRDESGAGASAQEEYSIWKKLHANDNEIGRERFVYDATQTLSGRCVVIKHQSMKFLRKLPSRSHQQHEIAKLQRELAVQVALRPFNHPNILCFEEFFQNPDCREFFAVYPRATTSLFEIADQGRVDTVAGLRHIYAQMAAAVEFLVSLGFVHRDLKLENFVITYEGDAGADLRNVRVQMIDFGWSAPLQLVDPTQDTATYEKKSDYCGTVLYMAPEVFSRTQPYDPVRADIWSLGVCFFTLGTLAQPYEYPGLQDKDYYRIYTKSVLSRLRRVKAMYNKMGREGGPLHKSEQLKSLVNKMMVCAPQMRYSPKQVVAALAEPQALEVVVPATAAQSTTTSRSV